MSLEQGCEKKMSFIRISTSLVTVAIAVAACEPARTTTPIALTPGTAEYQLRQQQLQNMQGTPGRAIQNPMVTGVNPNVGGIERASTGGTGTSGGALGGIRTDGSIQRPGAGAPATQMMVPESPRSPQMRTLN